MQKSGTFRRLNRKQSEKMARKWTQQRDRDLEDQAVETLHVAYHDLVNNPSETISGITHFLDIKPTADQWNAAVAMIEPSMLHNRHELCYDI